MRQTENLIRFIKMMLALWLAMCAYKAFAQRIIHVKHQTYEILYNQDLLTPECVYYTLRASDFNGTQKSKPKYFKADYLLPPPRRKNKDFRFTGYQRGHLCPSGDRDSRKDWFKDTFFTSNIVPMTPAVNAGVWKDIETECRNLASNGHVLKIACGSTAANCNTNPSGLKQWFVPDTLYKIAICVHCDTLQKCWLVPNESSERTSAACNTPAELLWGKLTPVVAAFLRQWFPQTSIPEYRNTFPQGERESSSAAIHGEK